MPTAYSWTKESSWAWGLRRDHKERREGRRHLEEGEHAHMHMAMRAGLLE